MDLVRYRNYRPDDFAQLYAIEEACFQPPFRFGRRYMRQLVQSDSGVTWIAEEDGKLAGFAIVEWTREEERWIAYIQTIEVAPGQRRRGIGVELLRRLEESAREAGAVRIWLHVDEGNSAAIELYTAQGYGWQSRTEHYYAADRTAAIYSKALI